MKRIILLLALASILSTVQAAELYRWLDSKGVVHYSDMPPPQADQAEIKKFSGAANSEQALPYETRRAQQNFPVTLFVASGCRSPCDQARSLLNKRGIPYTEKVLKTQEELDAFKKLSGMDGIPALSVGKTYLGGFLDEQWNSELDVAGYPKSAPYGSAPSRPPNTTSTPPAASQVAPSAPYAP